MHSLANTILQGNIDDVKHLLQHAQDIDINAEDEYGFTPLIEAAIVGKNDIAKLLIQHGADVNQQDLTGGTALHWAVENSNLPLCEILLKHKANPNAFNHASQPVLINPILRDQSDLKMLLYQYGASLTFAQDYINAKLIGHRFQLQGGADIVNANNKFISLSLEGFFLEFSLKILCNGLVRYLNNFSARSHRDIFEPLSQVTHAMYDAAELSKYQQYQIDVNSNHFKKKINEILDDKLLILPVNFEGHAITIVSHNNHLAICDRRMDSSFADSITIYTIGNPKAWTKKLMKHLVYDKKPGHVIEKELPKALKLQPKSHVLMHRQITGNCSWANVEAAIPVALTMLLEQQHGMPKVVNKKHPSLQFFHAWHEWDKDQALNQCIESFYSSNEARQIAKASLLGCVLFQRCGIHVKQDLPRVKKILTVLKTPEIKHILQHYIDTYHKIIHTKAGKNLLQVIEDYDDTN
jgi:hypothetical protein